VALPSPGKRCVLYKWQQRTRQGMVGPNEVVEMGEERLKSSRNRLQGSGEAAFLIYSGTEIDSAAGTFEQRVTRKLQVLVGGDLSMNCLTRG
jgi:hypothetical protein